MNKISIKCLNGCMHNVEFNLKKFHYFV